MMTFKLTEPGRKAREDLARRLDEALASYRRAAERYNSALRRAQGELSEAQSEVEAVIDEARHWVGGKAEPWREKLDALPDGDRERLSGIRAEEFVEAWEEFLQDCDGTIVSVEDPAEADTEPPDLAQMLRDLPTEPVKD